MIALFTTIGSRMRLQVRRALGSLVVAGLLTACTEGEPAKAPGEQPTPAQPGKPADVPDGQLPEAKALLAEVVTAMGGAAKYDALTGYYAESQLNLGKLGLTGTAKMWWSREGGYYIATEMPGVGLMKIGGTADKVWGDDPVNGLRTLTGKEAEQSGWSSVLCLAHEWRKYFKTAKTVAVTNGEGGAELAEIELTSPLGDKVVLRVDLKTKLPVSQSFTQANPLGDMPVTVTFSDYREVEGFKLPFMQTVDASLMKMASTTTKIELNPSLAGVQFEMPGAPGAVTPGAPVEIKAPEAKAADAKGARTAPEAKAAKQDKPAP
jgi:hypothetical protein